MVRKRIAERFIKNERKIRDRLFKPILKILTRLGLTATKVSNFKLVIFFPFLFLVKSNLKLAFSFVLLSYLSDIFDGPLARYQKKQSDRGKFLDIFGDFSVYLLIILNLFFLNVMNNNLLVYHLFIFPLVMILATLKKQENEKTDWIIKPAPELGQFNMLFLLFLFLYIYFGVNYLNLVLLLINMLYTGLTLFYFIYLQYKWYR
ncbi:CDP-alcohol phosphatidyltransferase family protein [Candidatus Woesearchaeota archaeon]|nr:CDP-alcohol phosphatidyltransferase family protein [Candidatus Woesearchaeota archaeon]